MATAGCQSADSPSFTFHLFSGQTLPPASASGLRLIRERTLGCLQASEPSIQLLPHRRREAIARSCDIHELAVLEIAAHDSIEGFAADGIAADDELLAQIDSHLTPRAGQAVGLIRAVQALRHVDA